MQHDPFKNGSDTFVHANWQDNDHLITVLASNAREQATAIAMRERDQGIWQEYNWAQYLEHVVGFAAGLDEHGVKPGDIVLILGDNRPNLYFSMLGTICLRAIPSPAYPDTPPQELFDQLRRERVRVAIVEDQEQVDKLLGLRETYPGLELIIYDDPRGLDGTAIPGTVSFSAVLARGREKLKAEPDLHKALISRPNVHDVAILLHSSGTTGTPKGIPLKHGHVLSGVRNAAAAGYFHKGEIHMAYLPIAWVGDFTFSIAAALELSFTINIPEAQETALHDLREIAPTLYFSSPRAWSGMLTRIQVGIAESTPFKRWLYERCIDFAVKVERGRLKGKKPSLYQRFILKCGEFLIYGPVKDQLGLSRVERAYTAGEAIGEDVFLFFRALGLNLRQFYGQTENCALAIAQSSEDVSLTGVGRPFPGVEVKLSDNGEIVLRGDNIFDGYYNDVEATEKTLKDGWLHTGDAGQIEKDGQIVVLGRVSEIVHTAANVRYIPTYIENRLKFSRFIKDVCVIGADKEYLSAILCIDIDAVGQWAQENGTSYTSYAELSQSPAVYDLTHSLITDLNTILPAGQAIERFVNLHKQFDPDDGEMTRTRKLRRDVIDQRYAAIIDAIYAGKGNINFEAPITYETGQTGVIARALTIRSLVKRSD
ncbi:AMP-binding protein [Phyllobacterium sp. YR531]|uniref:AMP-dependent synthetase/ligase n=1 Tax=Phyllobacterium sp. YR531 TaxID=1144343 RepID=UPI00026FA194|nr:AMP-binding protein [Phyllobacterium sp. YR531]EJN02243.1 AMP-forming long-chain acyl-CoA synthetase [Phyllobacterium sp. YR531]